MDQTVIAETRRWIDTFVIDLQLCPFARREFEMERVRIAVTRETAPAAVLERLAAELQAMVDDERIGTSLLVLPDALAAFPDYNDFLDDCEALLGAMDLEGVIQIASFHPHYRFAGTSAEAAENYSNRSPYPMLHLLREAEVEAAVAAYPGIDDIPRRNIVRLKALGSACLHARWRACRET